MVQARTDESAAALGSRIRRLRVECGVSLSELARRAGIGKATLSGLETGSRNPTVETLLAVAAQLGVPLAALLAEPLSSGGAAVTTAGGTPEMHGEAVTVTLLEAFVDGGVSTELYRLRIRPGRVQTSPGHGPGVVEYLTVFSGTARVGPLGAAVDVPAGGHGYWPCDGPHTYAALGSTPVEASLLIRHPLPDLAGWPNGRPEVSASGR